MFLSLVLSPHFDILTPCNYRSSVAIENCHFIRIPWPPWHKWEIGISAPRCTTPPALMLIIKFVRLYSYPCFKPKRIEKVPTMNHLEESSESKTRPSYAIIMTRLRFTLKVIMRESLVDIVVLYLYTRPKSYTWLRSSVYNLAQLHCNGYV